MTTHGGNGMSWYDMNEEQQKAIHERIRDYNWCEAFGYSPVPIEEAVAEVVAAADGCHDGDNWVGVFKLKDGRFLYVSAGCDYTGWDCRAGGHGDTRPTLDEVVRELCGDDDRARLGLALS